MQLKFKKSYKFALKSSLYVTLFFLATIFLYHYFVQSLNLLVVLGFSLIFYAATFFLIQFRVEHFIYKRVKKIYDDVSLLEITSYVNQPVTTDMATLTKEVKKFARDKKLEIETLKIREEYRKEFLGNVSHELKTPLFTIQGYLLTLLDGAMEDKNIRTKYLERAEKGVERLIYIVKDLDMITKLEVGVINLDVTRFNIVELILAIGLLISIKASINLKTRIFDRFVLVIGFFLFLLCLFYSTFLSPEIKKLTLMMMESKGNNSVLPALSVQHQFYHHLYIKLEGVKLVLLLVLMGWGIHLKKNNHL